MNELYRVRMPLFFYFSAIMTFLFTTGSASAFQRIAVSAALTLMASTGGPLSAATLGKDVTFSSNVASVPLIAEAAKLLMSMICIIWANASDFENDARSPSSRKKPVEIQLIAKVPPALEKATSLVTAVLRTRETAKQRLMTFPLEQSVPWPFFSLFRCLFFAEAKQNCCCFTSLVTDKAVDPRCCCYFNLSPLF